MKPITRTAAFCISLSSIATPGYAQTPLPLSEHLETMDNQIVRFSGRIEFTPPRDVALTNTLGTFPVTLDAGRDLRDSIERSCQKGCAFTGIGTAFVRDTQIWISVSEGQITEEYTQKPSNDVNWADYAYNMASCWNVGSLSRDALQTKVVVEFEIDNQGKPIIDTITLNETSHPKTQASQDLYETARRAIIRCGMLGDLSKTNFATDQKKVYLTFNPENMTIK